MFRSVARERVVAVALLVVASVVAQLLPGAPAGADGAVRLCPPGYVGQSVGLDVTCTPDLALVHFDDDLYAATTAQRDAVSALEAEAVQGVIETYGVPTGDTARVRTWARNDIRARLF